MNLRKKNISVALMQYILTVDEEKREMLYIDR